MNSKPLVSVIMPFFNSESYISDAINSILNQSFTDFEFLILNDASTDYSFELVKKIKDSRIKIFNNRINKGLVNSLNRLIKISRGKYIARMDADDISLPNRLEKQIEFLENNYDFGMVGTLYARINNTGKILNIEAVPISNSDIRIGLLIKNCFAHGSTVYRSSIIKKIKNPYENIYSHAEDYALWIKMSKITKMQNLSEVYYLWRKHDNSISSNHSIQQSKSVKLIEQSQYDSIKRIKLTEIIQFSKSALSHNDTIKFNNILFSTNLKREYQFILKEISVKIFKENLLKCLLAAFLVIAISPTNIFRKLTHD